MNKLWEGAEHAKLNERDLGQQMPGISLAGDGGGPVTAKLLASVVHSQSALTRMTMTLSHCVLGFPGITLRLCVPLLVFVPAPSPGGPPV